MSREARLPAAFLVLIILGAVTGERGFFAFTAVAGILRLLFESWGRLRLRKWNLDYLAFLSLFTTLFLSEWLTGAVIAFMVAVSAALEAYGGKLAESTLSELFRTIPKTVLRKKGETEEEIALQVVRPGDILVIRSREMLPVDGYLESPEGAFDEANLTGEVGPVVQTKGALIRGGLVNLGKTVFVRAKGDFEHSSYRKILGLVEEGKKHPAPLMRLSERSNILFTLLTLALALTAFLATGDPTRFLSVIVIATPCPLLIAAPLSFIGGLNRAARENIIVKGPFVLELLAKTRVFFFDKTGTLTLGEPRLKRIEILDPHLDQEEALNLAAALERHSLHPLAKSILRAHRTEKGEVLEATGVEEEIGHGIRGDIGDSSFALRTPKAGDARGIMIELLSGRRTIARFLFDDVMKARVATLFKYFRNRGYVVGILTGDKKENAERILGKFGLPLYAEATPERKAALIRRYQREGKLVGMVGDGMNDAPALSLADLGIAFSGTENGASAEAADVAILGRDVLRISDAVHIGRRSYAVALQSVLIGIGLSTFGMVCAAFGLLPPVQGAVLQEVIDAVVIVNALRSTY